MRSRTGAALAATAPPDAGQPDAGQPEAGNPGAGPSAVFVHSLRLIWESFVSLGLLLLITLAVTLSCLGLGLPLLRAVLVTQRAQADRQRARAGLVLGARIPAPYRAVPDHGLFAQLQAALRDPGTWRDLAWLWIDCTAGLTLAVLPLSLWLTAAWHFVLPGVLWAFFPGLRKLLEYAGTFLDGTSPPGYLLVPLLGFFAIYVALRTTGPIVTAHAKLVRYWLGPRTEATLARRVDDLARSRADSLDLHAAEIRRIERDLHDGAQARLVALGMSLGLAETLLVDRPEVRDLLVEARGNNLRALAELRELVHGIRPPVLADRGLDGAVRALALDSQLPVDVDIDLAGRPPAPAESAAYFGILECVTNAVKHAGPTRIGVRVRHHDDLLTLTVWDDGVGGADPAAGTGLSGVCRRLAAFDGTMTVTSPRDGPTTIVMELPCELSSPKTLPCSATD